MTKTTSKTNPVLRWNRGNVKLPDRIIHFSLPSGHSCPAALKCLAKAHALTGKITDGKQQDYRCYAAMQEARHSNIRNQRWNNFQTLRRLGRKKIFTLLKASLQPLHDKYLLNHQQRPIVRAHVGGDFFKDDYFLAWMDLARSLHPTQFYAYTKRLDLWVLYKDEIPDNFELNASKGGKFDDLIELHNLKTAEVVFSLAEAKEKGLELDHDDSHAYKPGKSFGHLIHGSQPAGSKASKALTTLKNEIGWTGYSANTKSVS
tara:strand:- start:5085 stop:5864 length:780 start_codon:yes stop_codon:yes gene_type:complete